LFDAHPETAAPLNAFADALMCGPSSLTRAEREIIATHVSQGNGCEFCAACHAAIARELLGPQHAALVDEVLVAHETADLSDKLRALLVIAGKVRQDGRLVTAEDVTAARRAGADDKAIHDTVLIAAAFCMFNRYVDGLGTAPGTAEYYRAVGAGMAGSGYRRPAQREA
jgi:uncharacterized peroxidase-related enzyme